ncbi:MAG: type I-F CRISPR-associated protein Csy2 [Algicola sp.]|nr:type I-F CRISPR-associated protein Csy2 [Algicola sp.]
MDGVLILRHVSVQNANAIAGTTWGFPAIANFLGFTHALQRQFAAKSDLTELALLGCGIVCHSHQVQAHKTHEYADHVFALTRNPLDKTGKSSSFVEEGRMHMDVSLVIPFEAFIEGKHERIAIESVLKTLALRLRLAGGTILDIKKAELWTAKDDEEENTKLSRRIMRSLLPGFALVSRQAALAEHQQTRKEQPGTLADYDCPSTDMQAWLEFSSLTAKPLGNNDNDEQAAKTEWALEKRPYTGWLRPIAVGYKAISPLYQPGEVANVRDGETPVRFVETLYSLGEWLSPHRIKRIEQLYWYYRQDESRGYYQCTNDYSATQPQTESA